MNTEQLVELVVMARMGDESAMQRLYLDTKKSVYYLALRMVSNPEDAEDITQEVFITVHQKLSELREPAAFYKWVNQITANKCNQLLRKHKGFSKLDDGDEALAMIADDDPLNLPDKALDDEDTRRIILEVIDGLPDLQRVCVMLYYYQQNTIAQIADLLDTNENTVKTRLSLARAKIKAALEEKEKKEGIKLYGIPLALTPILRQAMEDFRMPEDVSARIWQNVSQSVSSGLSGGAGASAAAPLTEAASTGAASTGAAAANAAAGGTAAGMALATKVILGIAAAAVIGAGAFFLPKIMDSDEAGTPTTQAAEALTIPDAPIQDGRTEQMDTVTVYINGHGHEGSYQGEYQNGLFNGYGVWEYRPNRQNHWIYTGNFADGVPDGQGTLQQIINPAEQPHTRHGYGDDREYHGNFAGGLADGDMDVVFTWYGPDETHTCQPTMRFNRGIAETDDLICNDCGMLLLSGMQKATLGVPPWAGPFAPDIPPEDGEGVQLPDGPVTFSEPVLEAAIRAWLNRPEGEIMTSELEKITTFQLNYEEEGQMGIRLWGNGEHNLDEFYYPTQDLLQSFADFDQFPHIRELWFHHYPELDLNMLSGLKRVTKLTLDTCGITDVSPLAGMSQLESLSCGDNAELYDISPLRDLNLTFIGLGECPVSDISCLAGMDSLRSVGLTRGAVYDLSPLADLPKLEHVSLSASAWRYAAPVSHVENIYFDGYPSQYIPTPPGAHPAMNCMRIYLSNRGHPEAYSHKDEQYAYYSDREIIYIEPGSEGRVTTPPIEGCYSVYRLNREDWVEWSDDLYVGAIITTQAMLGVPSVTPETLRDYCGQLMIENGSSPYVIVDSIKYELMDGGTAFMVTMVEE